MTAKRHLPLLAAPPNAPVTLGRAHWVILGALGIVLLWLPLAMLGLFGTAVLSRWLNAGGALRDWANRPWIGLLVVLPLLLSFAMASFFGAALLGRYALAKSPRLPVYAGLLAVVFLAVLAMAQGAVRPLGLAVTAFAVLVTVAVFSAFWGGRWGRPTGPD